MKKCNECGAELTESAVFCHECGARVRENERTAESGNTTAKTTMPPLAKMFSDAEYSGGKTSSESKVIFEKLSAKWDEIFARDEFLGENVEFRGKKLTDFGQGNTLNVPEQIRRIFADSAINISGSDASHLSKIVSVSPIASFFGAVDENKNIAYCNNRDKMTALAYIFTKETVFLVYSTESGKKLELSADEEKICVSLSAPEKDTISATAEGNMETALVKVKAFVEKIDARKERYEQDEQEAELAQTSAALDDALGDL